jgi:lipase
MPTIHSMGTTLHYGVSGDGPPVVALHGSASTGAQWRSLVGCLGGRHRVITPDLAGYGRSGLPQAPRTLAAEAAFLAPLVTQAGEPVHLVGHSFGGAVALEIASRMPACVRSLTLIEPAAFHLFAAAGEHALADEIRTLADTIASRAASGEREAAVRAFIDYWNGAGAWSRTGSSLRAFFLACLDRILSNFDAIGVAAPSLAPLKRIAVSTLALMGLGSRLPSMRTTELIAGAIPAAKLALIPDAGHMAPLTDPHLVDPLIRAHLAAAATVPALADAA